MAFLDEIEKYLQTELPTLAIVKGLMPVTPVEVVVLYEFTGQPSDLGFGTPGIAYEYPGLQIVSRGEEGDYVTPRQNVELVRDALAKVQGTTLGDGQGSPDLYESEYLICHPGSIFLRGLDMNKRPEIACNFTCEKRPQQLV